MVEKAKQNERTTTTIQLSLQPPANRMWAGAQDCSGQGFWAGDHQIQEVIIHFMEAQWLLCQMPCSGVPLISDELHAYQIYLNLFVGYWLLSLKCHSKNEKQSRSFSEMRIYDRGKLEYDFQKRTAIFFSKASEFPWLHPLLPIIQCDIYWAYSRQVWDTSDAKPKKTGSFVWPTL